MRSRLQRHAEHGQDWICCLSCGASWSVIHEEISGELFEGVEQIDDGDETCTKHDPNKLLMRIDNEPNMPH